MKASKSESIVIVGAGAFGLSTALHLNEAGYTNITVLEKDDQIPSRFSAANDLNKIVRAEYEDDFYTDLTVEAIRAWQTPLFGPYFHQTGFLHCVSQQAPQKAVDTLNRFRAASEKHPRIQKYVAPLDSKEDIRHHVWQYNDGQLPGWHGYLNRLDGYAHSADSLRGIYRVCVERGVRLLIGGAGAVQEIVYTTAHGQRKATGVRTKKGIISAGLIIVAAGAAAARLVPECGQHVVAKSWSVAHIQLTPEETSALRGIPVTYARDLGFFFEPDPATNLLKLCPMGGGYINTDPKTGVSHAPDRLNRFMPLHDQQKLRRLLQQTLPALADRPFVGSFLCWFADTSDSDFIIDYVPDSGSTVILMSGDSGHGFKMFPIVGKWVADMLATPDGRQPVPQWRWKAAVDKAKEGGAGGDWGGDVTWRIGNTMELRDLQDPKASKL